MPIKEVKFKVGDLFYWCGSKCKLCIITGVSSNRTIYSYFDLNEKEKKRICLFYRTI